MTEPVKRLQTKVIDVCEIASLVPDNSTVATSGFQMAVFPDQIVAELERSFLETGHPRDLTVYHSAGQGDWDHRGINRFAHVGMIRRLIGAHLAPAVRMMDLIHEGSIEAYNLPQGVMSQLFRAIASRQPGVMTKVGVGTFVDPRLEGGRLNPTSRDELVEVVQIGGEEYLFYKSIPINVAIIRGTSADERGNVSMEREAMFVDVLSMAEAAKASEGIVIAQVERLVKNYSLNPQTVKVPGVLVDAIVVGSPEYHRQTLATQYNPAFSGEARIIPDCAYGMDEGLRKIIAKRAAMELRPGVVVNLGTGISEGVAAIAYEEGIFDMITLTVEGGVIGGIPGWGYNFGAAINPEAIIDQPYMFDFYDGGGLDITFLGLGEVDCCGNLNVSKLGTYATGCGGFINIIESAKTIVFCGTFTAKELQVSISARGLEIQKEGKIKKFVKNVKQVTFPGKRAVENSKKVLIVTERAVFQLTKDGLLLLEVAPGVDIDKDVLAQMEFRPAISPTLKEMPPEIFSSRPIGLRKMFEQLIDYHEK